MSQATEALASIREKLDAHAERGVDLDVRAELQVLDGLHADDDASTPDVAADENPDKFV